MGVPGSGGKFRSSAKQLPPGRARLRGAVSGGRKGQNKKAPHNGGALGILMSCYRLIFDRILPPVTTLSASGKGNTGCLTKSK